MLNGGGIIKYPLQKVMDREEGRERVERHVIPCAAKGS